MVISMKDCVQLVKANNKYSSLYRLKTSFWSAQSQIVFRWSTLRWTACQQKRYILAYPHREILDSNESVPSAPCRIICKYHIQILKQREAYDSTERHSQTGKTQLWFYISCSAFLREGGNIMTARRYDWGFQGMELLHFLMEVAVTWDICLVKIHWAVPL